MKKLTFVDCQKILKETCLFHETEIESIIRVAGKSTIGNIIVSCQILGIGLHGSEIDEIINTAINSKGNSE